MKSLEELRGAIVREAILPRRPPFQLWLTMLRIDFADTARAGAIAERASTLRKIDAILSEGKEGASLPLRACL